MNQKKNVREQNVSFDIQGHRGCRGLMPENTVDAMLKAIDLGVTTLEMDASITMDKEVILSHEPFFNHEISTKPDGQPVKEEEERRLNMYRMNYAEVKTYDVGMRPHPRFPRQQKLKAVKPRLADIIDAVETYTSEKKHAPLFYNIETKCLPVTDGIYHPVPQEFVDLLMGVILSKKIQDRVIIQSFDNRTLQILHQKYPSIKTAMLIEDYDKRTLDESLKVLGFNPTIYSPEQSHVTKALIEDCHARNIKIIPWTINKKETIDEFRKWGVDGIITDYPDLF
jgi:glycerophosphoryl diester phosphodiesterase